MNVELAAIIRWYLCCVALGWGTLPLAYTCFRRFPERGFAFAKTQGVFLLAYLIWLTTSCGLTRYDRPAIGGLLLVYLVGNTFLLVFQFRPMAAFFKTRIKLLLLTEGLFLAFFAGCVVIRMYNPDLTGAEKEADFTFLNAILHSETFPPKDTWFAGASINYYYFGYLIWATLIKLTGVLTPIGFNLALATTVALAAAGSFGLVYHLTRRVSYSLLAPFCLCLMGNLDGLAQVLQRGGKVFPFDWWRSSRVIPDTINEFPYFSFLLGDLHAHFMAIPFAIVLFGLATAFVGELKVAQLLQTGLLGGGLSRWLLVFGLSLALGGASVINAWDYPTYLLLVVLCIGIAGVNGFAAAEPTERNLRRVLSWLALLVAVVILSRVLFWPFYRHYVSQVSVSNLRFVAEAQRTGLGDFLLIYGFFLGIVGVFCYDRFRHLFSVLAAQAPNAKLAWGQGLILCTVLSHLLFATWVVPLAGLISLVFLYLIYKEVFFSSPSPNNPFRGRFFAAEPPYSPPGRGQGWVAESGSIPTSRTHPYPSQEGISGSHSGSREKKPTPESPNNPEAASPYLFLLMAFAIILGCELVYIKDFYGHPLERQNTIFKFYYQAWLLLALGAPCLLARIASNNGGTPRTFRVLGKLVFGLLCAAGCIYPVCATLEKTGHFRSGLPYLPTLNGISYIAYREPDEYEALQWIQAHLAENAVILEATGNPYSFFGRVATTTGRSTVLGWGNHESLWRDQTWQSIMQRTADIKQMYEATDKQAIIKLAQKYEVRYIYVGRLERETYLTAGLAAFEPSFPPVFRNGSVTIYQISQTSEVSKTSEVWQPAGKPVIITSPAGSMNTSTPLVPCSRLS